MSTVKANSIYLEPIKKVSDEILNTTNNEIFLLGKKGSGKTTVINKLISNDFTSKNVFNISITYEEYRYYLNKKIYNLYYIALIMQKICNKVINKYPDLLEVLLGYNLKINNLLNNLEIEYLAYAKFAYFNSQSNLNIELVNNPTKLVDMFYNLIKDRVDLKQILFVFDNFDKVKNSYNYQSLIFNNLKKYFQVLYAVEKLDLNKNVNLNDSKIIQVNYSEDEVVIEEILDKYIINKKLIPSNDFSKRIRFILSKEDILNLIDKTNGNIYLMFYIINNFYSYINDSNIKITDYHLLFQDCLNIRFSSYNKLKRTLNLK